MTEIGGNMRALIDADVLLHELGWSGQFLNKDPTMGEEGEEVILPFEQVAEMLDEKIKLICLDCETNQPPILFVTDSESLTNSRNKKARFLGEEEKDFVPNFRYEVAKTKPYKGTRKNPKPFHFNNILAHMEATYDLRVAPEGLEADDALGIYQCDSEEETVICSRDKDLRMIPGWHFSWECGGQQAIGPVKTDDLGWLEMQLKDVVRAGKPATEKKVIGYGQKFFYFQLLCGDTVDNIPGLPKVGAVKAYELVYEATSVEELYKIVKEAYVEKLGHSKETKEYLFEQAKLLWILRENSFWKPPIKRNTDE